MLCLRPEVGQRTLTPVTDRRRILVCDAEWAADVLGPTLPRAGQASGASDRNADCQDDRPAECDDEQRGAHRHVQELVSHPGNRD
jgi:hypothetical protein